MTLYDGIGNDYAKHRRTDRRIAEAVEAALGDAESVANVGAGAGSYEPAGRTVVAVEPSGVMIRQRPPEAAPCLQGSAEALPLETASVDAAMTILSIHHWTDLERGLGEMVRVARKRIVVMTYFAGAAPFWLTDDYFPEITANDCKIFPTAAALGAMLERIAGPVRMTPVPIPHDCTDGMVGAFWRRPESYLDTGTRNAMSPFRAIDAEPGLARLGADLSSGRWAERNGHLLALETLDLGYSILACEISASEA